jgi:phage tail-like protein
MPAFPVNTHRAEPYKNFRFRVKWDEKYVLGVSSVSPLTQTVDTVTHREGGDPNIQYIGPGLVSFAPVTMERGITWDMAFEKWARTVFEVGALGQPSLKDFRKLLTLEVNNESGQPVRRYFLYDCWVSEVEFLPQLDANSAGYAMERLVIQYKGCERDEALVETMEP